MRAVLSAAIIIAATHSAHAVPEFCAQYSRDVAQMQALYPEKTFEMYQQDKNRACAAERQVLEMTRAIRSNYKSIIKKCGAKTAREFGFIADDAAVRIQQNAVNDFCK